MRFHRLLCGEFFKIRNALVLWVVALIPALMAVLSIFNEYRVGARRAAADGADYWALFAQSNFIFWGQALLPVFAAMIVTLLLYLEHHNQMMKVLLTLPVRRWKVYAAKYVTASALLGLSTIVLLVVTIGGGCVLGGLGLSGFAATEVPWVLLCKAATVFWLATQGLIAIQLLAAWRWPSLVVGIGLGLCGMILSLFAASSASWWRVVPWAYPVRSLRLPEKTVGIDPALLSVAAAALMVAVGLRWMYRRDVN